MQPGKILARDRVGEAVDRGGKRLVVGFVQQRRLALVGLGELSTSLFQFGFGPGGLGLRRLGGVL